MAIEQAEETEERWSIAELLRIKGDLSLLQGAPGRRGGGRGTVPASARSGAPARRPCPAELRAAASFARLLRDQGRSGEGTELLQPVYDRFTEGFDTVDLKAAKALLHDLH